MDQDVLSLTTTVEVNVSRFASRVPLSIHPDLKQAAWLGAIKAVRRFDPTRGFKLVTLADRVIKGSIRDFLRNEDPLSRDHRREVKSGTAREPLTFSLDAGIRDTVFVPELAVSAPTNQAALQDANRLLNVLPERSRRIVTAYFWGNGTMREIGLREGVHESRISQIIDESLALMRASAVTPESAKSLRGEKCSH